MSRRVRKSEAHSPALNQPAAGPAFASASILRGVLIFLFGAGVTAAAAMAIAAARAERSVDVAPAAPARALALSPKGGAGVAAPLERLLNLSEAEIARTDIARWNLACAVGLPGAEGLEIDEKLAELDRWAKRVASETERNMHRFRSNPAEYESSEAYFRALMLVVVLQEDCGVHYNPARINEPDFTNSKDLLLHGLVGDSNGGTCVSMPVLYVAVGRRLGYPMKLALTKGHVFARWDGAEHSNPSFRGRFNVDATSRGLSTHDDEHYATWPNRLSPADRTGGWFLKSLEPAEELAVFLMQRGHCLEDNGRLPEAQVAYTLAKRLAPKSPEAVAYLANALRNDPTAGLTAASVADASVASRAEDAERRRRHRQLSEEYARQATERGRTGTAGAPSVQPQPISGPPTPRVPGFPN